MSIPIYSTNNNLDDLNERCTHLKKIAADEISRGNEIVDVEIGWSAVDYVYVFMKPLANYAMNSCFVEAWVNKDTHYPLQRGYVCHECKVSIAGPIK